MDSVKKSIVIGRLAGPLAPLATTLAALILGVEVEEGEVTLVLGQVETLIASAGYLYGLGAAAWSKYKEKKNCKEGK